MTLVVCKPDVLFPLCPLHDAFFPVRFLFDREIRLISMAHE